MEALDKDIRAHLNLTKNALVRDSGKPHEKGATPLDHDNVVRLKRNGYSNKEIANALKISENEVELILELESRK
jgi:DNA-binding NarL/FixJ family response regulator